jgi:hypothetical protein
LTPVAKTVSEVDHSGELEDLYRTPECGTVDVVIVSGNIFAHSEGIYIDDDGYGKAEDGKLQSFFQWEGMAHPIAGKALLLGGEGDKNADTQMSVDEVRAKVTFITGRFLGMETTTIPGGIKVSPRIATALPGLPGGPRLPEAG